MDRAILRVVPAVNVLVRVVDAEAVTSSPICEVYSAPLIRAINVTP